MFFTDEYNLNDECIEFMKQDGIDNTINIFLNEVNKIDEWNVENINTAINNTKELSGVKGKMLYMPLRIKISGIMHGPELPITIYLLGKDKIIARLQK